MKNRLLPSLLVAFAAGAVAPAQDPPTLHELARTEAIGGPVTALALRPDGKRLLTFGAHGDLLLWELPAGRILRRLTTLEAEVTAVALHSSLPLALFALNYDGRLGAVFAIDLDTGRTRHVAARLAKDLVFSPDGTSCAVRCRTVTTQQILVLRCDGLVGEGPLPLVERTPWKVAQTGLLQFVTHPEGARAEVVPPSRGNGDEPPRPTAERTKAPPAMRDFSEVTATPMHFEALADDGTFAAADEMGQILVQGPAPLDRLVLTGHRGPAHRLVWSPDAKFLAVVSPGAVRVVDADGRVVADLPGNRHVQAGPEGSEFWLLGRHELRRWSAAERRDVGKAIEWSSPRASLFQDWRSHRPGERMTMEPALVAGGTPWLLTDRRSRVRHLEDAGFLAIEGLSDRVQVRSLHQGPENDVMVLCDARPVREDDALVGGITLWTQDMILRIRNGTIVARAEATNVRRLFEDVGDGSTILTLRIERDVERDDALPIVLERRRSADLSVVASGSTKNYFLHIAPLDDHHLLAATATALHVLDAATLTATTTLTLPPDLPAITTFAVAPDHLHIAIGNGPDVRILRVE